MDQAVLSAAKRNPRKPVALSGDALLNGSRSIPDTARTADVEAVSRQLLVALTAFSKGNFRVRLPGEWSGMDARIAEAFNLTIANAQRVTDEAARLSSAVGKEGRLAQRMSCPGALGSWAAERPRWTRSIR